MENNSKQSARNGCLWAVVVFQGIFSFLLILVIISVLTVSSIMKKMRTSSDLGEDESPQMEEIFSSGSGDTKVILVPIRGLITLQADGGLFGAGPDTTVMALKSIRKATNDPDVDALILDIDSGGGSITASDVIYKALSDFKASRSDRKVIAIFGDTGASGAYYLCLPADSIIAHPTTITGSIGVLIQSLNLKGLGERVGIKTVTVKSGRNKDMLNPFEDLTEEQSVLLQGVIDELHQRFVSLVASNRNLSVDFVREISDGRIFTASKAKEYGLVDKIGYWQDAVDTTAELLGVDRIKVFRYQRPFGFSGLFSAAFPAEPHTRFLYQALNPRFLYQFDPQENAGL